MVVATKTLSITDDAYQRLRSMKRDNESFSQVIQRLTGRQDLLRFAATIGAPLADDLTAASLEVRRDLDSQWSPRAP